MYVKSCSGSHWYKLNCFVYATLNTPQSGEEARVVEEDAVVEETADRKRKSLPKS